MAPSNTSKCQHSTADEVFTARPVDWSHHSHIDVCPCSFETLLETTWAHINQYNCDVSNPPRTLSCLYRSVSGKRISGSCRRRCTCKLTTRRHLTVSLLIMPIPTTAFWSGNSPTVFPCLSQNSVANLRNQWDRVDEVASCRLPVVIWKHSSCTVVLLSL